MTTGGPPGGGGAWPGFDAEFDASGMSAGEAAALAAFDAAEDVGAERSDGDLAEEWRTDLGNARRFVSRHGRDLMHVREIGWMAWDGKRWKLDYGEPMRRAHLTAEAMVQEALAIKDRGARSGEGAEDFEKRWRGHYAHAIASSQHGAARAMIASAEPYCHTERDALDDVPYRLNVANGTLHMGEATDHEPAWRLFKPRRSDRATLLADVTYDKAAKAPRWRQFVAEVMPDKATRLWLQRWLGYCLTGDISEQCIAIFEGKGANGKSTLVDVVARMLGDYAVTVPIETFLHQERRSGSGPTPDLARLPGARLVRTSEPEPGARLSESTIKQFTGGERITARHLFRDMFEFKPAGKLVMSVNIRPTIVGKDYGIRRRIHVVPFRQQFQRTPGLIEALLAEKPGILNWLLEGYAMWREDGLGTSTEIQAASKAYFEEMDPIGSFVEDCCETGSSHSEFYSTLRAAYLRWCTQVGEDAKGDTPFGRRISDMGFGKIKSSGMSRRTGLRVKDEWKVEPRGSGSERED
jgi:putative DNA primase/helicase